jgi:hypothetical protein
MIDYTSVTREIRSIVSRRRELLTFLGSVFAAMGLLLENIIQGNLPTPLKVLERHAFALYAFLLMVPSLILALRLARLNAGMTLNGVLYQRLMQDQDFTRKATPQSRQRAACVNYYGVSFLMFVLSDLIAGFSVFILVVSLQASAWLAVLIGAAVVLVWLGLYLHYHHSAAAFALRKAADDDCAPFTRNQWEEHVAGSMEDANHDMIAILALVGLILFSGFESLSGLGRVSSPTQGPNASPMDLPPGLVLNYGPVFYGLLMTATCFFGMVTYIRLRIAIGQRSLEADPSDNPFKPLKLTDSLLGYMILAFLFVVSLHFLVVALGLKDEDHWKLLLAIDGVAFVAAVLVEQVTLVLAGRRYGGAGK